VEGELMMVHEEIEADMGLLDQIANDICDFIKMESGVEAEYFHFKYSLFPAHFSQVFIIPCLF